MSFLADVEYVDHGVSDQTPLGKNADGNPMADNTIVCLHGIGGDQDSFRPQLESLSDEYRVIAWNMPGYRGSKPLEHYSFATLGHQFMKWLDAMSLDKVHLVGQSIGGMLAQHLGFYYPDRVRSLVLIATTSAFGGRDDEFRDQFLRARLAPLDKGETMPGIATRFVPEIVGSAAPAAAIEAATASMSAIPENTW